MADIYRGPSDSPRCAECPCAVNGLPVKPIRGGGAIGSLAIVGEGPASEEMMQGWPFVGASGKLLQQAFTEGGIDRHSIWITNAILCQRPYDPKKLALAVECCRPRLKQELESAHVNTVCALGATAAQAMELPVRTIKDARGTVQVSPIGTLPTITTIHPAAILRGGAGEVSAGKSKMNVDAQYVFLAADVAKAYALSRDAIPADARWSDNIELITACTVETSATLRIVAAAAFEDGLLGIDLEWGADNVITWLGLATARHAVSIYLPHAREFTTFLRCLGGDPRQPKLFHNLQADVPIWEAQIGPICGQLEDTMLMHHAAYPGAAHDLQNVATQFLLVPPWKASRRGEEKRAKRNVAAAERLAKKSLKQMEHEARNAASAGEAVERKRKRKAAHDDRNTTAHILKLMGDD